jgi:hypothetical protein
MFLAPDAYAGPTALPFLAGLLRRGTPQKYFATPRPAAAPAPLSYKGLGLTITGLYGKRPPLAAWPILENGGWVERPLCDKGPCGAGGRGVAKEFTEFPAVGDN